MPRWRLQTFPESFSNEDGLIRQVAKDAKKKTLKFNADRKAEYGLG
jgi:hypothetical protein